MNAADKQRLAEIRERESRATKGAWLMDETLSTFRITSAQETSTLTGGGSTTRASICGKPTNNKLHGLAYERGLNDFAFIAHSRDDIPWLLSQLDAALAEVERLTELNGYAIERVGNAEAKEDQLRAEVERLREALALFMRAHGGTEHGPTGICNCRACVKGRAALTPASAARQGGE